MNRILASVTSLEQHLQSLVLNSDAYRPVACPHCERSGLWHHGRYYRKADRRKGVQESLNLVPVPRFLCRGCTGTCSRLPACIAPWRWYDWLIQQAVLLLMLGGCSVHRCARSTGRDRCTVRRWRDWLAQRGDSFAFFLRSRFPELGRVSGHESFWRHVIESQSLREAMVWVDRELSVP